MVMPQLQSSMGFIICPHMNIVEAGNAVLCKFYFIVNKIFPDSQQRLVLEPVEDSENTEAVHVTCE